MGTKITDFTKESFDRYCYEHYAQLWCTQRGTAPAEFDKNIGINGEFYASYDEFMDNEYNDHDIMEKILPKYMYEVYCSWRSKK